MTAKKPPEQHKKPGPKSRTVKTDSSETVADNEFFRKLLGLNDRRLRELGESGLLVRSEVPGQFQLLPSLINLIEQFTSKESETERATKEARRQKEQNIVLQQEIEISKTAGELLDAKSVEAVLADLLVTSRQGLESMSVIIDGSSASVDDKAKCKQLLSQTLIQCGDILERTSQQSEEFYTEDEGFIGTETEPA